MIADGKYSADSKEFYLKEYEALTKTIESHWSYMRSVERYVAIAVIATWAWLVTHPDPLLPKWTWLTPVLFVLLGALRCHGIWKQFSKLHHYLQRTEKVFSGAGDPGGWEHFLGNNNTALWKSTGTFWTVLALGTIAVAIYEYSN